MSILSIDAQQSSDPRDQASGDGVGSALLLRLVDAAGARGDARVILNAQVDAMPFYARHGFVASGDVFDEAGIAHRVMQRPVVVAGAGPPLHNGDAAGGA